MAVHQSKPRHAEQLGAREYKTRINKLGAKRGGKCGRSRRGGISSGWWEKRGKHKIVSKSWQAFLFIYAALAACVTGRNIN